MRTTRYAAAALTAAALLTTAACSGTAGDKSGGSGPATVLVLANNDGNLDGIPAIARFVDRVAALSAGKITVRVESEWQGGGHEAQVIRDVGAGKADLGWSGTRAFDTVGVTAFQPLHAPFLIGTFPAEAAVLSDPVAGRMLGSVQPLGLTGLAMLADELRVPAAAAKPLLTPADFRGLRFGTVDSAVQSDALRALGAQPTTLAGFGGPDLDGLGAVETMWWTFRARAQHDHVPFITANAALWPRSGALFANSARLAALGEQARGWIQKAAGDAAAWSVAHAADKVPEEIKGACGDGARIALATPQQLAALRAAGQPVYDAIKADPAAAANLARIEELVRSAGPAAAPAIPAGCAYQPGDQVSHPSTPTLSGPGRAADLPQGTYRYALSEQELLQHGLTPHDAHVNAGVVTWTLKSGRWHAEASAAYPSDDVPTDCAGWYDVQGDKASFTTTTTFDDATCAPPTWSARWSFHGNSLTWTDIDVSDFAYVWGGKSWQRID